MKNKNLILGIAAGVAALAVVGVICNKKGYINFDSILDKAGDLAGSVKDSISKFKDSAVAESENLFEKGKDLASKAIRSTPPTDLSDTVSSATT